MTTLATVIAYGLYADLPAFGMPGRQYFAYDTGEIWYDNGSAWDNFTAGLSAAAILALQQQAYTYAADTGAANAYAVALSPAPTLEAGSVVFVKIVHANTGASTLAVNGGGAIAIKKEATVALAGGELRAGQIACFVYDGTYFQMQGAPADIAITALTGDVTASGPGSAAATLAATAVTPGSYTSANITVDTKGRVTAAANGSGSGSGQTTVSGSTSGTAVFSQPEGGACYKKVIIRLVALVGTASYTFPVTFSFAPDFLPMVGASGASVTALSDTAVTITGTGQTGVINLEGY